MTYNTLDVVILAAGKSKRFQNIHKTLVALNDNLSLIEYSLIFIRENNLDYGNSKIIVVINKDDVYLSGDGKLIHPVMHRITASPYYTPNIEFVFQSPDENGPAAGLRAAGCKITGDYFVLFGDNYYSGKISTNFALPYEHVKRPVNYEAPRALATYKLIPEESDENLRLAYVDVENNRIIEKPHEYRSGAFFCGYLMMGYETVKNLRDMKTSTRGEYEITEFFNSCEKREVREIGCAWSDITQYSDVPGILEYIKTTNHND